MIGRHKHCISLAEYSREEILEVLDLAVSMKEVLQRPIKKVPSHFGLIARVMLLLNGLSHRLAPGQLLIQRALIEALMPPEPSASAADALPPGPDAPPLFQALRWMEEGRFRAVVDRVLPLHDVAEAHRVVERREHFGKVVLEL